VWSSNLQAAATSHSQCGIGTPGMLVNNLQSLLGGGVRAFVMKPARRQNTELLRGLTHRSGTFHTLSLHHVVRVVR
jgi:hypothetical protein